MPTILYTMVWHTKTLFKIFLLYIFFIAAVLLLSKIPEYDIHQWIKHILNFTLHTVTNNTCFLCLLIHM